MAGVSASTVSRVLSRPDMVAEETRTRVAEAVAATGYRLNRAARNLRKQRTGSVVALVPNLGNPFFAKILDGMGRELAAAGYDLLVADTLDEDGRHRSLRGFLDTSRADGIILLDGLVSHGNLQGAGLPPVVTACEWIEDTQLPRVALDNRMGGQLALAHLRDLGHTRIGLIGGPPENVLHKARLQGAFDMADGVEVTIFDGDFSLRSGQIAAQRWMSMPSDERPTAIFAFSDEMACAFQSGLIREGFCVPRDVSLIGFDDIDLASHLTPALTTVRQPKRALGQEAARTVLARIEGKAVAASTLLQPRLMLRETTGRPSPV